VSDCKIGGVVRRVRPWRILDMSPIASKCTWAAYEERSTSRWWSLCNRVLS